MGAIRRWLAGRSWVTRAAVATAAVVGVGGGGYQIYVQTAAGGHLNAARAAERDRPADARKHLAACLDTWPNDGEANFLMARAARRDGDFTAAFKFLRRADEVGWEPAAIDMEKTLLRAQTGDFRQVEHRILDWARRETDDLHLFLEVLIPAYRQRHDLALAHDLLTAWVRKQPTNVRALEWLVEVCERLEDVEGAVAAAEGAVAAAPDRADLRAKCGQLLLDRARVADAEQHLRRAVELDPANKFAQLGLAKCLIARADYPAAAAVLDPLALAHPTDPLVLGERGRLAVQAGKPADAVNFLKRSLDLGPTEQDYLLLMGQALEQLGRAAEAKEFFDRHATSDKDLTELREVMKQIARDPRNADLRYKAGVIAFRNRHTTAAVGLFQSALAENPRHEPSRKALAEAARAPR